MKYYKIRKSSKLPFQRQKISTGTKWETQVGYSRAVRVGNVIEVSGTTALNGKNKVVGEGDAYEQTRFILRKIEKAIHQADGKISDVVRTRIFVTNIMDWEEIAKAHSEFFKDVRPATTLVEVSRLVDPAMLVEIEATVIIQ